MLKLITFCLVVFSASLSWVFILLYTNKYRWWRNIAGRLVMSFASCLALFLTYYSFAIHWPTLPGKVGVRVGLLAYLDIVILAALVLLIKADYKDTTMVGFLKKLSPSQEPVGYLFLVVVIIQLVRGDSLPQEWLQYALEFVGAAVTRQVVTPNVKVPDNASDAGN